MQYKVLIVGLGQIGMGYDEEKDCDRFLLTHAQSFSANKAFKVIGGVDPDIGKRLRFSKKYSVESFEKIEDVTADADLVVVSCPTSLHCSSIISVFKKFSPKILLCEKPISNSLNEAEKILDLCQSKGSRLLVNYFRRSEIGSSNILRLLETGEIKGPFRGQAWYSKGLFNSASHFIDLLRFWFGEVESFKKIKEGRRWKDNDPEPDFVLSFKTGEVLFSSLPEENFFHNSIQLFFANGLLSYEWGGSVITWQKTEQNDRFTSYRTLSRNMCQIKTDFDKIQGQVVAEIEKVLEGKPANLSEGLEAFKTLKLCVNIGEKQ